jgi:acetyl esterase/lipase
MKAMVREDGISLNSLHVPPPLDDAQGWKKLRASADAFYTASATKLASSLRSTVKSVCVGKTLIHVASPQTVVNDEAVFIDLHGGALVMGGGQACLVAARSQADRHGMLCYGVDYRMPPDDPFPAALDDCVAAYRYALETHHHSKVVVGGRSAGGNLAVALLHRARDEGLPMPGGLVLLSPQLDLTESGDSFEVNRGVDPVLPRSLMPSNLLYAQWADLKHRYLSPLFGEFSGFPPTFIQSGTRDLFLSNAVRLHRALRRVGVRTDLHVFEAMPHGGFTGDTPEDRELISEIERFVSDAVYR